MVDKKPVRVRLEAPTGGRAEEFFAAAARSKKLHGRWAKPPTTPEAYLALVKRANAERCAGFFVVDDHGDALAGVVELSEIVRGGFQSAYLGYYALEPYAGKGYMRAGLIAAINHAFRELKLHRLEANIQPDNRASIRLVESLGFRLEGLSRNYLKVAGRWRDHERWAILVDEWRPAKR